MDTVSEATPTKREQARETEREREREREREVKHATIYTQKRRSSSDDVDLLSNRHTLLL